MIAQLTEHEPTDACIGIHCHSHMVDEEGIGYIFCGECGHVYRTAGQLRRAYRRGVMQGRRYGIPLRLCLWRALTVRAKQIFFCQECIHDF